MVSYVVHSVVAAPGELGMPFTVPVARKVIGSTETLRASSWEWVKTPSPLCEHCRRVTTQHPMLAFKQKYRKLSDLLLKPLVDVVGLSQSRFHPQEGPRGPRPTQVDEGPLVDAAGSLGTLGEATR